MNEYIVFEVKGGAGKNVMATAVIKALKKQYPKKKILIVTAWEDLWYNNPNVHKILKFGELKYFYEDYILDKDTTIMIQEVYNTEDYIYKRKNLIESWCDMYDIPYNGEQPELFFTQREINYVYNTMIAGLDNQPIFLIQPFGGSYEEGYSWARDIPVTDATKIVAHYNNLGYKTYQIKGEKQIAIEGAEGLTKPVREIAIMIMYSDKRLFIDSLGQHIAAALGIPSTVCWIVNTPKVFGYEMHDNIITDAEYVFETTDKSYLEPYDIIGKPEQNPFNTKTMFSFDELVKSIDKERKYDIPFEL
jgi:hypothetical protein